jgi:2-polyprenyl-3-methyl-5-hydroxy-6-metoxy-1,4-benzoquinol methylase
MSDITAAPSLDGRWNANASFWVQIIREHRDKYRNELTDPAMLDAIGTVDGLAVLDAGCGEGYLARLLASRGATVTGIDFSSRQIEAARAQNATDGLPVTFDVGNVDDLPYDDGVFDLVVCNHLVNDLQEPSQPIREFARVLRSGGRLIILMLHPCFYNKHAERHQATNGLLAASYFDTRSIEQHFEVDGLTSPVAAIAWFRPLEFYIGQLRESGFVITSLTEPHPSPSQVAADPWWRTGFTRPLFMLMAAERRLRRGFTPYLQATGRGSSRWRRSQARHAMGDGPISSGDLARRRPAPSSVRQ